MSTGVESMGRPKKQAKKVTAGKDARRTVIHMKGSPEYVEWLERLHRKTHISKVELVRIALAEWTKQNKHEEPPEI